MDIQNGSPAIFPDSIFTGRVIYQVPPDKYADKSKNESTPNVFGLEFLFFQNTIAQNVTALNKGSNLQTLRLIGDGFTTLKYNNGGAFTIITNTGVDKLLVAGKIYTFFYFDGSIPYPAPVSAGWIEDTE